MLELETSPPSPQERGLGGGVSPSRRKNHPYTPHAPDRPSPHPQQHPTPRRSPSGPAPLQKPRAPLADRVRDLLGRMTLEEKVMQMVCINYDRKDTLFTKERRLDEGCIRRGYPDGLG